MTVNLKDIDSVLVRNNLVPPDRTFPKNRDEPNLAEVNMRLAILGIEQPGNSSRYHDFVKPAEYAELAGSLAEIMYGPPRKYDPPKKEKILHDIVIGGIRKRMKELEETVESDGNQD